MRAFKTEVVAVLFVSFAYSTASENIMKCLALQTFVHWIRDDEPLLWLLS